MATINRLRKLTDGSSSTFWAAHRQTDKLQNAPLHKEGDPEIASNNRPISLLSCLSKICDKVALNQYTEHLTNHRLLTEHQSGNRKKHSTETLNIAVTDMLLEAMDNKQLSVVILLDMSKAVDSVDHNMLLQRILNLGVSSAVHKWFKSYLSDR